MKKDTSLSQKITTLGRLITWGVKDVFRNAWLSLAAMAVMFVALGIIMSTLVLNIAADNAIKELSKNLKVSIYLTDDSIVQDVPVDQAQQLRSTLNSLDYVDDVDYVSKAEARERFSASFRDDESLLEGLTLVGGDTLPASYEVSVTDLERFSDVADVAQQERFEEIIESITLGRTDAQRTIDRAAAAQQFITHSSMLAAGVFTFISMLIIFNTIRIAIFTRSEEIRSMKLIGATRDFIRGPFLVAAAIYGLVAGVLAASVVYSLIISLGSKVASQAEFTETYIFFTRPDVAAAMFAGLTLLGILVGLFSSALAMKKHLKLKSW